MATLPNGLITFGPLANCTLELCPIEASLLRYQPNKPSTIVFIAVFGLSLLVHAYQGMRTKAWGFMASMLSGCILEIVGYIGRLIIHSNPFDFQGFLMQISMCIPRALGGAKPSWQRVVVGCVESSWRANLAVASLYHHRSRFLLLGHLCPTIPSVRAFLLFCPSPGRVSSTLSRLA